MHLLGKKSTKQRPVEGSVKEKAEVAKENKHGKTPVRFDARDECILNFVTDSVGCVINYEVIYLM